MDDSQADLPVVRVEPSGIEFVVAPGQTLMAAARERGYYWPNQCDMACRCSNCFVLVEEGAEHLSAMGRAEHATLIEQRGRRALDQPVRLACQAMVSGNVVVEKRGVRPS